jgi:hypothetical protein
MSLCTESTDRITINTVLPRHSSFQESFDQFVDEFEFCFGRFGGKTHDWLDDDYAALYGRESNANDHWEWD